MVLLALLALLLPGAVAEVVLQLPGAVAELVLLALQLPGAVAELPRERGQRARTLPRLFLPTEGRVVWGRINCQTLGMSMGTVPQRDTALA